MNTDHGRVFYDMTKIRSLTDRKGDLSGQALHVASADKTSSASTIPQDAASVNAGIPENDGNMPQNRQILVPQSELDQMETVSEKLGVKLRIADLGEKYEGFYQNGVITISPYTSRPALVVYKHELTHYIAENTKYYGKLRDLVKEYYLREGANYPQLVRDRVDAHEMAGEKIDYPGAEQEVVADFVGEHLFTDEAAIQQLVKQEPNLGMRIKNWFGSVLSYFKKNQQPALLLKAERLYQKAIDQVLKQRQKGVQAKSGDVKHSIDPNFEAQYDRWNKKDNVGYFKVGTTSKALESIGITPSKIYWDKSKIIKIQKEHPDMTDEVIKQVPQLLENPMLIMQSQTAVNRIVALGEVYADGKPILCALELRPNGNIDNFVKIASAYPKNSLQNLVNTSDILYINPNKNRTDSWLKAIRLQLPSRLTNYGPIHNVTYVDKNVKGDVTFGEAPAKTAMQDAFEKAGYNTSMSENEPKERISRSAMQNAESERNGISSSNANVPQKGQDVSTYSLQENARTDVEKALNDKNHTEDVYLTESSPSIIANQKGVRNLPMLMKASHIRENVFTEQEAKKFGLKTNQYINYHGLGKDLFLKIIEGLDGVKLAYRGTKNASDSSRRENYFLLISQYKDVNGNTVNVPVYIDEKGQYNRVFIDTNKIATVFGRDNFSEYIQKEVKNGNLVRIKNKSTQASELTSPINASYSKNASSNITVPQKGQDVNTYSMQNEPKYSLNKRYLEMVEQYGKMKPGEHPARDVDVPKQTNADTRVRQGVRTIMEAKGTPDTFVEELKADIADGVFNYEVISDKEAVSAAKNRLNKLGIQKCAAYWKGKMADQKRMTKFDFALAEQMFIEAGKNGDSKLAEELVVDMTMLGTEGGQLVQAQRILKNLTPNGRLYKVEQIIQKIQQELDSRFGKKSPTIEISEKLKKQLHDAKSIQEMDDIEDAIMQDISKQLPAADFARQWNEWRYLAMLGNPKTHIRNIFGNLLFTPAVMGKNAPNMFL